jgi:enoyl-CoA hydratase/carnithine racemase
MRPTGLIWRGADANQSIENVSERSMNKVRFETAGPLGILSLANPPLNLFSQELIDDLRAAVTKAKETSLRGLLVRADGKVFSGGADVSVFKGVSAAEARKRFTSHLRLIADLEELPFPTVAAVQGLCIAAGLELVLACDLIWAASSASFGQAEASIGTTTLLGGVQRLAERAGPSRAREVIYSAAQYDAATFERWNIVNKVVPDGEFEAQTKAFAGHRYAAISREPLQRTIVSSSASRSFELELRNHRFAINRGVLLFH